MSLRPSELLQSLFRERQRVCLRAPALRYSKPTNTGLLIRGTVDHKVEHAKVAKVEQEPGKGRQGKASPITLETARSIIAAYQADGATHKSVARSFGVSLSAVHGIVTGRTVNFADGRLER